MDRPTLHPIRPIQTERRRAGGGADRHRDLCRRTSDFVRNCREASGLDAAGLAERLGVPEHIVALWEDPTYEGVDLAIMRRVARAAGGELEFHFRPGQSAENGGAERTAG